MFRLALEEAFPARFTGSRVSRHRDPEDFAVALVRAVIAQATVTDAPVHDGVDEQVAELLGAAATDGQTLRFVELVQNLDVAAVDGAVVAGFRFHGFGDISGHRFDRLRRAVSRELPEAIYVAERTPLPGPRDTPAMLVAEMTSAQDAWGVRLEMTRRAGQLLTALRLATGATIEESTAWIGEPRLVHIEAPLLVLSLDHGWRSLRRVGSLRPEDLDGLGSLTSLVADVETRGVDPLVVALGRFNRTFRPGIWQDIVLDLAIALEAVLAANRRDEIGHALRTRAAILLATPGDPSDLVYDHVKPLYDLRSRVVHGGAYTQKEWTDLFRRFGATHALDADKMAVVIDRWRDLVRRAILTRIALGMTRRSPAEWRHGQEVAIDRVLASPDGRRRWRTRVRTVLTTTGLPTAVREAPPLIDRLAERPKVTDVRGD